MLEWIFHLMRIITKTVVPAAFLFASPATSKTFEVREINDEETVRTQWDQEYATEQLFAVIGDNEYLIAPNHERWMGIALEVKFEGDLDNDGLIDAVISSHQGGNCCAPYYFVVSHRGDGFFSVHTHDSLYGYEIDIVKKYDEYLIEVLDSVSSSDYPISKDELTLLRFSKGNLEVVSRLLNTALIPTLVEVTGQDVREANKLILFDVDGDGNDEEMIASYWDRWGTVIIEEIVTTSHGKVTFSIGCGRIGFMKTTTNGLHDIICNRNDILTYDPESRRYR